MKTLVFCNSYAPNSQTWQVLHRLWLGTVIQSGIVHVQILVVDGGSAFLPAWMGVAVVSTDELSTTEPAPVPGGVMPCHFIAHVLRSSLYDFPGWQGSFTVAALKILRLARLACHLKAPHKFDARGFSRLVHQLSAGCAVRPA